MRSKKKFTNWMQMQAVVEKYNREMEELVPELPYHHTFSISSDGSLYIDGSNVLNPYEAQRLANALYNFYCTGTGK